MSIFKNENELHDHLIKILKPHYLKTYKRVNLTNKKFEEYWSEWFGYIYHTSQPEIDLLLVDKHCKLYGVEVKYFKKGTGKKVTKWSTNASYHEGLNQAIAQLRFGLEKVCLLHVFDSELPQWVIHKYELATEDLMKTLNLPIQYLPTYLEVENNMIYLDRLFGGAPLKPFGKERLVYDIAFDIKSGRKNPFVDKEDSKKILGIIKTVLKIPAVI